MFIPGLIQILHFSKIFLAAWLQNLSNSFGTLLGTFRIQMCWRQLLCFWLQELLERKSLFLMQRLSFEQQRPSPAAEAKDDFLKETSFFSSSLESTFKQERQLDEPAIISGIKPWENSGCKESVASFFPKHRKNCECCPVSQLIVR